MTTVRVSLRARQEARALAEATGRPISEVIEDAILAERRRLFWRRFREAAARAGEQAEAELFEVRCSTAWRVTVPRGERAAAARRRLGRRFRASNRPRTRRRGAAGARDQQR